MKVDFLKSLGVITCFTGLACSAIANAQEAESNGTEKKTAKQAWEALIQPNLKRFPAFKFVEQQEGLPNVLIYGDSISIGYTPTVQKQLAGKVNVYRVHCNGGHTKAFVPRMRQLARAMRSNQLSNPWDFKWDIIHVNVGLHDLKYVDDAKKLDKKNGKLVSTPEQYKAGVKEVMEFLKKEHPDTQIIFATTTPVPDGEAGRHQGDAEKYNKIALDLLKESYPNVVINDLYSFIKPHQKKVWIKPGDVHYSTKGKQMKGVEVAKVIANQLETIKEEK